jgi:flagellar FliL protein
MPVKAEAPPAPAAKVAEAPAAPPPPSILKASAAWLPAIATIIIAPVLTWAAVEYVMLPRLQKKLAAPQPAQSAVTTNPKDEAPKMGPDGKPIPSVPSYEFSNIVVNLAGTMGTRYLRTTFIVTGTKKDLHAVFENAKPRLTDVTINVLSSLTLADLDEPGSKNVIREKLVGAFNQTLGSKVAEQVYFSDFMIQ